MSTSSPLNRWEKNVRFGEASSELLSDFLSTINNQNKSNLENVSSVCGNFKDRRVVGGSKICEVACHVIGFGVDDTFNLNSLF